MSPLTVTTFAQARSLVSDLSAHFNIPTPEVVGNRGVSSRAYRRSPRHSMTVGERSHQGLRDITLHEFAHILCFHRHTANVHHNWQFVEALKDVIRASGLALEEYGWHLDYECVWKAAWYEGLTTRRWHKTERREVERVAAVTRFNEQMRAVSPSKPAPSWDGLLRRGMVVTFVSTKLGGPAIAVVESAERGCRARVRLQTIQPGTTWYVPQGWCTPVIDQSQEV